MALVMYSQNICVIMHDNNDNPTPEKLYNYDRILLDVYTCNYNSQNDSISFRDIKERAILMSFIEWIPQSNIPNNIAFFQKNKKVIGLPYSSVKELQKFIGLDVSIYTFLTAVKNPYSLLYTEDVAMGNPCYLGSTYNGKNCHTFYGTVCSSFIAFCFKDNNNYTSFNYKNGKVSNYYRLLDHNIDSIMEGDLFWTPGHIALITDIETNTSGQTTKLSLYESASDKVHIKNYTRTSFLWKLAGNGNPTKHGYIFRNKLIKKTNDSIDYKLKKINIQSLLDSITMNDEICTWFGDKPCIAEWDRLKLNFNKKIYNKIIICKDNQIIDTLDISNLDHSIEYKLKGAGLYKAQLASDSNISQNYTCFEVINTNTKLTHIDNGLLEIVFPNNSDPEIVYWINQSGEQYTFPITITDNVKNKGRMIIKPCNKKDAILRVIYRGRYGRAINKPNHLFNNQ